MDLEDKDLSEIEMIGEDFEPSPIDIYGSVFPPLDLELEDRVDKLPLKFEFKRVEQVPTLFIHTKEYIEESVFEAIFEEVEDFVEGSASLVLQTPYMIVETHSYCLNLDRHMRELYAVLSKHIYGNYKNHDSDYDHD